MAKKEQDGGKPQGKQDGGKPQGKKEQKGGGGASGGKGKPSAAPVPLPDNYVPRLKEQYQNTVIPALIKQFNYKNVMQVPKIEKVVINMGVGQAGQTGGDAKLLDNAVRDMTAIAGQKPVVTKAKKSIANFRLREGVAIGCKVTLRGVRMYEFLDRLFNITLPRVRDFQGVNPNAFDGRGNYSLGMKEQLTFPEIVYDKIDKIRGMDIIIVTNANTDQEARYLLHMMGMPFRATGQTGQRGATRLQL